MNTVVDTPIIATVVNTPDLIGPVEVSPNVADVPVPGETQPNKRTYKVVRRVYTRGPYRGRQTIRQEILKVNRHQTHRLESSIA